MVWTKRCAREVRHCGGAQEGRAEHVVPLVVPAERLHVGYHADDGFDGPGKHGDDAVALGLLRGELQDLLRVGQARVPDEAERQPFRPKWQEPMKATGAIPASPSLLTHRWVLVKGDAMVSTHPQDRSVPSASRSPSDAIVTFACRTTPPERTPNPPSAIHHRAVATHARTAARCPQRSPLRPPRPRTRGTAMPTGVSFSECLPERFQSGGVMARGAPQTTRRFAAWRSLVGRGHSRGHRPEDTRDAVRLGRPTDDSRGSGSSRRERG